MKRSGKLVLLVIPWFAIWLLGVSCALLADGFSWLQGKLSDYAAELNEEIQKL